MAFVGRTAVFCMFLAGCGQASASVLDSRDDLHCALAAHQIQLNLDNNATLLQRQGIHALRSWYYAKLPEKRLSESPAVLEAMKTDQGAVLRVARECLDRAELDKDYYRFSELVAKTM
jgi:hypothetical protein